jgi:hypothetical protein
MSTNGSICWSRNEPDSLSHGLVSVVDLTHVSLTGGVELNNDPVIDDLCALRLKSVGPNVLSTPERKALIEAHKALTHAQRLIDRALGRGQK